MRIRRVNQTQVSLDYFQRIEDLRQGGYRLVFDTSKTMLIGVWAALLVHHNGKRVRLIYNQHNDHLRQYSNDKLVYDSKHKKMCES